MISLLIPFTVTKRPLWILIVIEEKQDKWIAFFSKFMYECHNEEYSIWSKDFHICYVNYSLHNFLQFLFIHHLLQKFHNFFFSLKLCTWFYCWFHIKITTQCIQIWQDQLLFLAVWPVSILCIHGINWYHELY